MPQSNSFTYSLSGHLSFYFPVALYTQIAHQPLISCLDIWKKKIKWKYQGTLLDISCPLLTSVGQTAGVGMDTELSTQYILVLVQDICTCKWSTNGFTCRWKTTIFNACKIHTYMYVHVHVHTLEHVTIFFVLHVHTCTYMEFIRYSHTHQH